MGNQLCGTAAFALVLMMAAPAGAQEWKKGTKDEEAAKTVEYKASAQAGLIITTGNSKATTLQGGAKASRKQGFNKLRAEVNGAYARSSIFIASDDNMDGFISQNEIQRPSSTSTRAWDALVRYDRFLTAHNALYGMAKVGADVPAGKELVAGAQVGYSRLLYKDARHELVSEVGYDFSYEDFPDNDGVSIHSGRAFAGYAGKVSADTGVAASVEVLVNVNSLDAPGGEVEPFEDARVNGQIELTTKLRDNISFGFSFAAKFDNAPAPRAAFGVPYEAGFVPLADELDTITKASLIVNFL